MSILSTYFTYSSQRKLIAFLSQRDRLIWQRVQRKDVHQQNGGLQVSLFSQQSLGEPFLNKFPKTLQESRTLSAQGSDLIGWVSRQVLYSVSRLAPRLNSKPNSSCQTTANTPHISRFLNTKLKNAEMS